MVVRVAGVVVLSGLAGELLGGGSLGAGVEILDLGLTEDAGRGRSAPTPSHLLMTPNLHVGVAVGRLVHLRVVDDEEDLSIC